MPMSEDKQDMPYMMKDGTLVIPFACPDHSYKYWKKEGKKLSEVLAELETDKETWAKFTTDKYPDEVPSIDASNENESGESESNEGEE